MSEPMQYSASNPGRFRPQLFHYYKCYPTSIILALVMLLGVGAALVMGKPKVAGIVGVVTVLFLILEIINVFRKSKLGDVNPGVIISVNPPLVAVITNLTKSNSYLPALEVTRQPLSRMVGGPPTLGKRVPTVSTYHGGNSKGWDYIVPEVINCMTTNHKTIQRCMQSIPAEQWSALEIAAQQLQGLKTGTYKMWKPGWQGQKKTIGFRLKEKIAQIVVGTGIVLGVVVPILFGKPNPDLGGQQQPPVVNQPAPEVPVAEAPVQNQLGDLAQANIPERTNPQEKSEPQDKGQESWLARQKRRQEPQEQGTTQETEKNYFAWPLKSKRPNSPEDKGEASPLEKEQPTAEKEPPLVEFKDSPPPEPQSSVESRLKDKLTSLQSENTPAAVENSDGSKFKVNQKVQVKWGAKWWPCTVLKVQGDKTYIHYDGWGKNFDEWVGPDRIRASN